MRRFWVLARAIFVMNARNKAALFGNLLFPIGLYLLFATVFGRNPEERMYVAAWFMAGVIVQNIMTSGFSGDATWLANTRDNGILLRIRASPLPPAVLVGAYVAARLLLVVIQSASIMLLGVFVFGVQLEWAMLPLALGCLLLGGLVFLLLGQAIAAVTPNASAAGAVANVVFFPLLFLSNLVVQADSFPQWLNDIVRWNPAYMLVDLVRPALVTIDARQATWLNLVGLVLYGAAALLIAARWFRWAPKR